MISEETWYQTHNQELLAIVEALKTWRHDLEGCKYKVLVFTNHNNLHQFMDTRSLRSNYIQWAQELSRYHFSIDYRWSEANAATNALSHFGQKS